MQATHVLFPLAILASLAGPRCYSEDGPDPKMLLRGVLSIREQIPPSHLHIRAGYEGAFSRSEPEYIILFNRELRYFASTNSTSALRMLFDGKDVIRFDGESSVILRDLDTQMADYLFDPRLLGITTSYAWGATIQNSLHLQASHIELVGREEINGKTSWHVRMVENNGCEIDIWIDDTRAFSVYRVVERFRGYGYRTAQSFYDNANYPRLPSRVEGEEFDSEGKLLCKRRLSILGAGANVKISDSTWTLGGLLAGLKLPTWVPVTDVRTRKLIGYWRDGRLGPPVPWEPAPVAPKLNVKRVTLMAAMALLLFVPIFIAWWNRARRDPNQSLRE